MVWLHSTLAVADYHDGIGDLHSGSVDLVELLDCSLAVLQAKAGRKSRDLKLTCELAN